MRSPRPSLLLFALLALVACSGPSGPAPVPLKGTVRIAERGAVRATIDPAWVAAHPPDFAWGEGQGWHLGRFFSDRWGKPGFELRVTAGGGDAVVFPNPGSRRDGRAPVLILNKKGEAVVTLAESDGSTDPFHGRGGARKRSGDDAPRVVGVTRLELVKGGAGTAPHEVASPPALRIEGAEPATLTAAELGQLPTIPLVDDEGSSRGATAWDLRVVVARFGAVRVVGVVDRGAQVTPILPEEWDDKDGVPSLRVNRRGVWRFQWLDPAGAPAWDRPSASDVVALQIGPR